MMRLRHIRRKEVDVNGSTPLDVENVVFSEHALRRFAKRYRELYHIAIPEEKLESTARTFLTSASEGGAITEESRQMHLEDNGGVPARYLAILDLRFVIVEEDGVQKVVTAEKILYE